MAGRQGSVSAAVEDGFADLDDIAELGDDIDADEGPFDSGNNAFANEVFTRYTEITEAFFDATSRVALSVDGAELRNGVEIVDAATRQSEMRARIVRDLVLATLTGPADRPERTRAGYGTSVSVRVDLGCRGILKKKKKKKQ